MKVGEDGRSPRGRGGEGARRRASARLRRVRLFAALYPPESTASALLERLARESLPEHRTTALDRVHLTALFIGEVDARDLERVRASVLSAASSVQPFELQPLHLAPLPEEGDARLVAAVTDGPSQVFELHERLAHRLASRRRKEARFLPHLTLCRFARPARVDVSTPLVDVAPFRVDALHLMESRVGPEGVQHRGLARAPLRD